MAPIISVKAVKVGKPGQLQGFEFVKYSSEEAVRRAIINLEWPPRFHQNTFYVEFAHTKKTHLSSSSTNIYH